MRNNKEYDINECSSRGVCSLPPAIAAMQELTLLFIEQCAYYILRLEKLGGNSENHEIINHIAVLNSINAISEKQLYEILQRNFYLLKNLENTYIKFCKTNNVKCMPIELPIDYDADMPYYKAIATGERLARINNIKNTKKMTDILLVIIKSVCHNLSALINFEEFYNDAYEDILQALNTFNNNKCENNEIEIQITKLAQTDNTIKKMLSTKLQQMYGKPSLVNVSHSSRHGKAILVSGSNFTDLYNILELTKDKDIDVYTHSNLLISHSLKKFREYKNLIGHYGNSTETCILDFGTFPGAILLTKGERNNGEYLYRGRLFSNDYITSSGMIKIENSNYQPVIEAALNAKGFSSGKIKAETSLGFNEDDIIIKFDKISQDLKNGKIKHIYIIGFNAFSEVQKEYFRIFFEELNNDEFALSFYYKSERENVLTVNVGNYAPFASYLLSKLIERCNINKMTFIFTTCDAMTVSSIVMLKHRGAQNIYMTNCSPTVLNPSVFSAFTKKYNVNVASNAQQDIFDMRS